MNRWVTLIEQSIGTVNDEHEQLCLVIQWFIMNLLHIYNSVNDEPIGFVLPQRTSWKPLPVRIVAGAKFPKSAQIIHPHPLGMIPELTLNQIPKNIACWVQSLGLGRTMDRMQIQCDEDVNPIWWGY